MQINKRMLLTVSIGLTLAAVPAAMPAYGATHAVSAPVGTDWGKYFPRDLNQHWAEKDITDLIQAGTLQGSLENGQPVMRPDAAVTRAEFVTILLRAIGGRADSAAVEAPDPGFGDVQPGAWYYGTIAAAKQLGLVDGVDAAGFQPNRSITRAEIATVLVRALQDSVSFTGQSSGFRDTASHWAAQAIQSAANAGIVNGYEGGAFKPQANATRAEAAVMVRRGLQAEQKHTPADSELFDAVKAARQAEQAALEDNSVQQLIDGLANWYQGYAGEVESVSMKLLKQLTEQGVPVGMSYEGTPDWRVVSKSDQYAVVQLRGETAVSVIGEGSEAMTSRNPVDDLVYLRKQGGKWVIYGSDAFYNQLRQRVEQASGEADDALNAPSARYLDQAVQSAVMHPSKPRLYTIDAFTNEVAVTDFAAEETLRQPLEFKGEKLVLSQDGTKLYAAETVQEHSSYWWEEEQSGYVTIFDAATLQQLDRFETDIDPYDLVVDRDGYIYVTSGSGQWTHMSSYHPDTHQKVSQFFIRQASSLTYDPVKNRIFAVDSDSSPRDFEFFDVSKGQLVGHYDSPYHGDYDLDTTFRVTPDGRYLLNGLGEVFRSTYSRESNMTHVATLEQGFAGMAFDPENGIFFGSESGQVTLYDESSLEALTTFEVLSDGEYLFYQNGKVYVLGNGYKPGSNRPVWIWEAYDME